MLSSVLKRAGYDVMAVADAEEALEVVDNAAPTVVVCDWMMPGLSGPEFCQRVRAMERDDYIYILILTSITEKSATAHALDVGADDFLTKPVDTTELRSRVRAGARVIEMQAQVLEQNRLLSLALEQIQGLYSAIDRDLAQARQLQHALLPEAVVDFGGATAGFLLRSAGKVGGDLVGHFPAGEGKVGLFSLDVSGHGVTSALLTARLAGMFSNSAPDQNVALTRDDSGAVAVLDPSDIVAEINRQLLSEIDTELYLTLCLVVLDLASGAVDLVQAGHPHPLLRKADGTITPVGDGGMPVGLLFDVPYDTVHLTMEPGDQLLLQSDGFVECPGPGGDMLGDDGLQRLMGDLPRGNPTAALERLLSELGRFADGQDFPDDVSAILLEFAGSETGQSRSISAA